MTLTEKAQKEAKKLVGWDGDIWAMSCAEGEDLVVNILTKFADEARAEERERCAKVAEKYVASDSDCGRVQDCIAESIRSGE